MKDLELVKEKIKNADYLLIGIGTHFSEDVSSTKCEKAYQELLNLIAEKNYFIITEDTSDILEKTGFNPKRITAPVREYKKNGSTADANWELYTKWIMATMNRVTCILELGVTLEQPNIIRWPFEKMASINAKSDFIRVNKKLAFMPEELVDKAISIAEYPDNFITQ
ncbi:hypothetical protein SAMN05216390_1313 [Lachnospiraceae bacterium KH1T2]|nr:hypothetical protein SAMN05216390_1313 [Lachnospiraceae bacterium KH1T2]